MNDCGGMFDARCQGRHLSKLPLLYKLLIPEMPHENVDSALPRRQQTYRKQKIDTVKDINFLQSVANMIYVILSELHEDLHLIVCLIHFA